MAHALGSGGSKWSSWQSAPDWLTATWKGTEEALSAWRLAHRLLSREEAAGERIGPLTMHGFQGWQGRHIALGKRGEEVIVRCGGESAARWACQFLRFGGRPSRLDVQTTVRCVSPAPTIFGELWDAGTGARRKGGRPVSLALTQMKPAGTLLTVGRRSSAIYGRAYDKGIETHSAPPFKLLRFEVEAKKHAARALGAMLCHADDLECLCSTFVSSQFSRWGLTSRLPSSGREGIPASRQALSPRAPSDAQRKLEWTRTTVRPFLNRLLTIVGERAMRDALGWLPAPPDPRHEPGEGEQSPEE